MALARLAPALRRASGLLRGVSPFDLASLACFLILSWVMLVTLPDYGLTYDEESHIRYGDRVLEFYASGFRMSGRLERSSYGAGFDVLAALLRRASPWDAYRTNHVLCAFVAQLGLLGTWKLGRLVAGPLGGLLSLGFLVLTPVYYGHQFNNPKDIPFAAGYVWGLYFIARLVVARSDEARAPGALGYRYWLGLAVALGLGMSVRVGGAILLVYLFLFLALCGLDRWRVAGRSAALGLRRDLLLAWLAALGGWVLMLAFWPRALQKPLEGPAAALETVSRYTAYDSPTLLRGELISSHRVPWDYLPTYFGVQLPELTLLCLLAASAGVCVQTCFALARRSRIPLVWWLLVFAVWVPPSYAIVRHSNLYNGLRHFLFIIPPIGVLAGSGVTLVVQAVARRKRAFGVLTLSFFGLFAIDQLHALWRLHPHQHVFFNRASGGLVPAVERYETEYYGSVYQELLAKLREQVWVERRDSYLSTIFTVAGCGSKLFFTKNLPLNFQYQIMRNARHSDFYATYARDRCLRSFRNHPVVVEVERDGATLAVARDLKRKLPQRPRAPRPEQP